MREIEVIVVVRERGRVVETRTLQQQLGRGSTAHEAIEGVARSLDGLDSAATPCGPWASTHVATTSRRADIEEC